MSRVAYILVLLVALAVPALAYASPEAVIRDCADNGRLDHHYSNSDLQKAEKNLPSDLDEYSDCRSVIAGAITGGSDKGGGRSGGRSGGSSPSAKAADNAARARDRAAHDALTKSGRKPRLKIGGKTIEPGDNGLFNLASASNGLPLPLLLALIAVALLTAGGGLYVLRRRVPGLARVPLPRLPLPRIHLSRVPFARWRR